MDRTKTICLPTKVGGDIIQVTFSGEKTIDWVFIIQVTFSGEKTTDWFL
jgi:hypothetical protein